MCAGGRKYVRACVHGEWGGREAHVEIFDLRSIDVKHELPGSLDGVVVAVDPERHIIPALSVYDIIHIHCCGHVPTTTQPSRNHELVSRTSL